MIANRNKKIGLIHAARKTIGLDEEAYRSLLFGTAGITSLTELRDDRQFQNIMEAFKKLGFISGKAAPPPKPEAAWGGTEAQRKKIETMWRELARCKTDGALRKFIKRIAKVDSPRFLTVSLSQKVILALEKMSLDAETGTP